MIKIHLMVIARHYYNSFLPPLILVGGLSYLYLSTMAPGLTWANNGADGGDLITAAVTNGVAHPTGYPLYLILAKWFQLLPFGSLAYRTNLMSGFFAILTALLIYAAVLQSCTSGSRYLAGLASGCSIGLTPLFWSQAVITEVYTLHTFFLALIFNLVILRQKNTGLISDFWLDCSSGLVCGLGVGNHITTVLLIPGLIVLASVGFDDFSRRLVVKWISLGRVLFWTFVGASIYLVLPVRALAHPQVNWGNPVNLRNFWWLVSGQVYREYYFQYINLNATLLSKLEAGIGFLFGQLDYFGIILGIAALAVSFEFSKAYLFTIYNALIFFVFALLYHSPDAQVYFLPVLVSFSVWIGIGVERLLQVLSRNNIWLCWIFTIFMFLNYSLEIFVVWPDVDASQDNRAESFGSQMMLKIPGNAIVFAKGDKAVFALQYYSFVLKQRPDMALVATDLLYYEWYQESLRETNPGLIVPGPLPFSTSMAAHNPSRPICYVKYNELVEYLCEESH